MVPETVKPGVRHLKYPADVGGLVAIEEKVRIGSIAVVVLSATQKAERYQSIEEIARRTGMQPETAGQRVELFGTVGEFGEDSHFDSAEQRFRCPEAHAHLHDVIRGRMCGSTQDGPPKFAFGR